MLMEDADVADDLIRNGNSKVAQRGKEQDVAVGGTRTTLLTGWCCAGQAADDDRRCSFSISLLLLLLRYSFTLFSIFFSWPIRAQLAGMNEWRSWRVMNKNAERVDATSVVAHCRCRHGHFCGQWCNFKIVNGFKCSNFKIFVCLLEGSIVPYATSCASVVLGHTPRKCFGSRIQTFRTYT